MKTFYVLWDGSHYLYDEMDRHGVASYTEYLGEAMKFDSLKEAWDFVVSSGLEVDILKVELTLAHKFKE